MDRNVTGITYTTYIVPSLVNSNKCGFVNVRGVGPDRNFEKSSIKGQGPPGNCRKQCEKISGKFNLPSEKRPFFKKN